jgi:hypothetical protein
VSTSPSAQAAATYLRELLLRPGRPRRKWEQYSQRSRVNQVNQLAVAEVLAQYLWQHPRKEGEADLLPRQLKDTVSRALSGKLLARTTLELFLDAFSLPDTEREHLWRLWEGSPNVRMLAGSGALSVATEEQVTAASGPPGHETLSLHDHVEIDVRGRVQSVRTIQVIEALRDGLDRIPYVYDTSVITVETRHGCSTPADTASVVPPDLHVTSLPLIKCLARGDTLTLEYITRLRYQGPVVAEQLNYRRAVRRRVENVDLRVQFDPDNIPPQVWWAIWDGVDGEIIEQQPASLDSQHSAHRYLRVVEKTVLGFCWAW